MLPSPANVTNPRPANLSYGSQFDFAELRFAAEGTRTSCGCFRRVCRLPACRSAGRHAVINNLIAATAKILRRPHQLLLTGDQIYRGRCRGSLLLALSDAADTLLGWSETLPVLAHLIDPATKLPMPALRYDVFKQAGFTSVDLQSHLMSLGEYLCMYLFVWSDVLWHADLPTAREVAVKINPVNPDGAVWLLDANEDKRASKISRLRCRKFGARWPIFPPI